MAIRPQQRLLPILWASLLSISVAPSASSAERVSPDGDAIHYRVTADTYARFFQRGTSPLPGGGLTETEMAAPLYHYSALSVHDVDAPWRDDSIDVELAVWGNLELTDSDEAARRFDGDVTIANVGHRFGYGRVRLGRQIVTGGAARFVRFDGASAGAAAPFGLGIHGYGGFTVLPRWDARPAYHLLGSAGDSLYRDPEALPEPDRQAHWLAGGRAFYRYKQTFELGASFHEQREQEGLARRDAAADLRVAPIDELTLRGLTIVDVDSGNVSDARAIVDAVPIDALRLSAAYGHVVPALFLSRQSVLSVFSTDAFDEAGGEASYRPIRSIALSADGFVQHFSDGELGTRSGGRVRFSPQSSLQPVLGVSYRRVSEPQNGYHGVRVSLGIEPIEPLRLTVDGYGYLYDERIEGISASWVGAAGARWAATNWMAWSLSGSLARSPYALRDAQLLSRLEFDVEGGAR